jgi:3-oxoacyl-[acyl-carrier-protein] synthase II
MALKHQILPPCVGLKEPEFELDLVTAPRRATIEHMLCFSFGFGGQNAVIALGQATSSRRYRYGSAEVSQSRN